MYRFFLCLIFTYIIISQEEKFSGYWYQGAAEISSFELEQARYGEIHKGKAVLIFVTEDFSKSKHVKLDYPQKNPKDAVKVLKLNSTRKFLTGIYPYSMMTSVFSPLDLEKFSKTLKITTSSQEWCGHTFLQFNKKEGFYNSRQYSYFEMESDKSVNVKADFFEDEIWTLIRLNPKLLPQGNFSVVPSAFFIRLRHLELRAYNSKTVLHENNDTFEYKLEFIDLKRFIKIRFNKNFPYDIISWEEEYESGWGKNKKILRSKAKRIKKIMIDYWNKNKNKDRKFFKNLGL